MKPDRPSLNSSSASCGRAQLVLLGLLGAIVSACGLVTPSVTPRAPEAPAVAVTGPSGPAVATKTDQLQINTVRTPNGNYILIADVDDTIRVAETRYPLSAVLRGLFGAKPVAGMASLIQGWNAGQGTTPVYVSNSPTFLEGRLHSFLQKNRFPEKYEVRLKTFLNAGFEFKVKAFAAIMASHPEARGFVFIGDDTQADAELFDVLRKLDPEKVAATYIHRVKGNAILEGQLGFLTAMDLALYETRAGRMTSEQALAVGDAILSNADDEAVRMLYSYCPSAEAGRLSSLLSGEVDPAVLQKASEVEACVQQICDERAAATADERASD